MVNLERQRAEVTVDEFVRPGESSVVMIKGAGMQPGVAWVPAEK